MLNLFIFFYIISLLFNKVIIMRFISSNPFYISPPSSSSSSPVSDLESVFFDQDHFNEEFYQKNKQIIEKELNEVFENCISDNYSIVLAINKETESVIWLTPKVWIENELANQNCYFFHLRFNFPSENGLNAFVLTDFSSKEIDFHQIETPPQKITQAVFYLTNKLSQIDD